VADHRNHHAHSDDEYDVHSPKRGFAWAHMFWWMTPDVTSLHTPGYYKKWAPDLYKDPIHRWIDSYQIMFPILLPDRSGDAGGRPLAQTGGAAPGGIGAGTTGQWR
jgi:fatty-acid desaturase